MSAVRTGSRGSAPGTAAPNAAASTRGTAGDDPNWFAPSATRNSSTPSTPSARTTAVAKAGSWASGRARSASAGRSSGRIDRPMRSSANSRPRAGEFERPPTRAARRRGRRPPGSRRRELPGRRPPRRRRPARAPSPRRRRRPPPARWRAVGDASPPPARPPRRRPARPALRRHGLPAGPGSGSPAPRGSRSLRPAPAAAPLPDAAPARTGRSERSAGRRRCAQRPTARAPRYGADLSRGGRGVVPQPARRRAAPGQRLVRCSTVRRTPRAPRPRRRRPAPPASPGGGSSGIGSGTAIIRHTPARPTRDSSAPSSAQPGVGDGGDGRPQPGQLAGQRLRRRSGGSSRKASTAGCSGAADVGAPPSRMPRLLGVAGPARSTSARAWTSRARHLDGHAAQSGGGAASSLGRRPQAPLGPAGRPPDRVSTVSTGPVHRRWTACSAYAARRADGSQRRPSAARRCPSSWSAGLVAALMAFGAIAASDAFLEQQEVQSVCDGAALAAANQADEAARLRRRRRHRAAAHAARPRRRRWPTSSPTAAPGWTPGRPRPTAPR